MIFHYHLLIGEVRTIRNETTYPIHGKYPLSPNVSNLVDKCGQHCWQQGAALSNSFRSFYFILLAFEARRLAFLGAMDTSCRRDCSLHSLKRLHMTAIEVAAGVGTGRGDKATQDWEAVLSQVARKELWQS